jgi:SAM-dependent methyltransferase
VSTTGGAREPAPQTEAADGFFGEPLASRYDESSAEMFEPGAVTPVVDVLAEFAAGGRALELGIGTGRIALPVAARGVPVHGIDLSRAMVARLLAKPGADAIGVTIGGAGGIARRSPPKAGSTYRSGRYRPARKMAALRTRACRHNALLALGPAPRSWRRSG